MVLSSRQIPKTLIDELGGNSFQLLADVLAKAASVAETFQMQGHTIDLVMTRCQDDAFVTASLVEEDFHTLSRAACNLSTSSHAKPLFNIWQLLWQLPTSGNCCCCIWSAYMLTF